MSDRRFDVRLELLKLATYDDIARHFGHEIEVALYGNPAVNAAIECIDCGLVLIDHDRGGDDE